MSTTSINSTTATPKTILRVDASARKTGSVSRDLTDRLIADLSARSPGARVITRDVSNGLPFVTETWIGANFTDDAERTDAQRDTLALSDTLIAEIETADILAIGVPVYNFGIPASLKAWVDQIARARKTFQYTENGPVGLLKGKKAVLVVASGGTAMGSDIDFATGYMRHVLGFIGIDDVSIIAADQLVMRGEDALTGAEAQRQSVGNSLAVSFRKAA